MKKIIHLSDLHLGYPELAERFDCTIRQLIFEKEPADDYVVVITGDLVENAHQDSFDIARAPMERLRDAGFEVLAVPGNHDYGTGSAGDRKFVKRFKKAIYGDTNLIYPKLDIIEGVAFLGLDSMAEELNWHDSLFAQGELGKAQLRRLDQHLGSDDVKTCSHRVIYLHHHPFDPRPFLELKDSAKLKKVVLKHGSVDAILYGHNHQGRACRGKWHVPRCYDDGSATRKNGAPGHHRVIDLQRDPRKDYAGDFHCPH